MSLDKFRKEFPAESEILHVVICVTQNSIGITDKSPVNQILEGVQQGLKEELDKYQEIQVAFVYQTPELEVKDFQKLEKNTPIYYREPTPAGKGYNLVHVWLMGLVLLEKKQHEAEGRRDSAENRLYLLTDERVPYYKANLAVVESEGEIRIHPRFEQLKFYPFLFRSKDANGDILEKYIRQHGECKVWEGNQLVDVEG